MYLVYVRVNYSLHGCAFIGIGETLQLLKLDEHFVEGIGPG